MFAKETKILVVDDAEAMRQFVTVMLGKLAYKNIQYAVDGQSALKALKEAAAGGAPFGLVLSDMNMPEMDGLELAKAVRSTPELKDIPFVMITAERQGNAIVRAVSSGVSAYLIKPFNDLKLQNELKAAWDFHHAQPKA